MGCRWPDGWVRRKGQGGEDVEELKRRLIWLGRGLECGSCRGLEADDESTYLLRNLERHMDAATSGTSRYCSDADCRISEAAIVKEDILHFHEAPGVQSASTPPYHRLPPRHGGMASFITIIMIAVNYSLPPSACHSRFSATYRMQAAAEPG